MEFTFACPHCGQHLSVDTADVGTVSNCPTCSQQLTVPSPPLTDAHPRRLDWLDAVGGALGIAATPQEGPAQPALENDGPCAKSPARPGSVNFGAFVLLALASLLMGMCFPSTCWVFVPLLVVWVPIASRWVIPRRRRLFVATGAVLALTHCIILAATHIDLKSNIASLIRRPQAAKPFPTRADFDKRLASVGMHKADGRIVVADGEGRQLRVESDIHPPEALDMKNSDLPEWYTILASSGGDGSFEIFSNKNRREAKADRQLYEAVEALIEWSITAVENRVARVEREISKSDVGSYVFHGDLNARNFWLGYERVVSFEEAVDAMQRNAAVANRSKVAEFERAHLWKYLFDHLPEILAAAEADFEALRARKQSQLSESESRKQTAQAQAREREMQREREQKAELDKLNKLFPKPGQQ